jgi:protein TonB
VVIKHVNPVYPELAKKAGIEGMVVVKVLVNTKGDVEKAEIFKSHALLDKAAIDAARQFKFKPGKQRDKYVKVWVSEVKNIPTIRIEKV